MAWPVFAHLLEWDIYWFWWLYCGQVQQPLCTRLLYTDATTTSITAVNIDSLDLRKTIGFAMLTAALVALPYACHHHDHGNQYLWNTGQILPSFLTCNILNMLPIPRHIPYPFRKQMKSSISIQILCWHCPLSEVHLIFWDLTLLYCLDDWLSLYWEILLIFKWFKHRMFWILD